NPIYVDVLQQHGLVFSGYHEREDGTRLMEFLELPDHPFFVATQAHPEFKSRLGNPHPMFVGFVSAALKRHAQGVQPVPVTSGVQKQHVFV
ncbi:MAG: CTP synthase, partial [Candidatus Babeliales bacterium]